MKTIARIALVLVLLGGVDAARAQSTNVIIKNGNDVTLGSKADAKSTATDTTAVTIMQVLKEISAMEQAPASRAVTNAGTFATQSAITAASGSVASGAFASGSISDGAVVTLGAKADAKSTATDTTAVTLMQVAKEQSFAAQNPITASVSNLTATLTLPSATTAYTAGQLIANSATAGSVVNPTLTITNSAGGALISRMRLSTNDATSTAWGAATIQIDLWSTTPTWTNGDRAAWSPATGAGAHLGAFTCVMSAEYGDGAYAECFPTVGNGVLAKLASGTSVFVSLQAVNGSGVTGASKVFTVTAEVTN